MDRVNKFKYLGCTLIDNMDSYIKIGTRVVKEITAMVQFQKYLCRKEIFLSLKLLHNKMLNMAQNYGTETCPLKLKSVNR